ncbi:MAG: ion channel [Gemmatimonadota bacterium]|nr:ion channel [Gemmatimonadota bacterium]
MAGARRKSAFAPYHTLLGMSWGRFLALVAAFYVLVNAVFALAYLACGPGALIGTGFGGHSQFFSDFFRAYFFSVETFGTIGYGNITPSGIPANILLTVESFIGLLSAALATGLVFARFSRPTAAIVYSRNAVIAPYRDMTAFMFRCANARSNQLIEVSVRIMYSRIVLRPNGDRVREFTSLPLEFDKVTFFALSWTVVHPIDSASPLFGCSAAALAEGEAEFLVLLSGNDETFSQTVHSRTSYRATEIVWGAKFRSMFLESPTDGTTGMDPARIHDYDPVPAMRQ